MAIPRMSSAARKRIPGAHTELATPVPIPTTVVKQLGPMIVQLRESRLVPGPYTEPPFDSDRLGAFFLYREVDAVPAIRSLILDQPWDRRE